MTSNDLWPPWKRIRIIYPPRATDILYHGWSSGNFHVLRCVYVVFRTWPLVTSHDLWPPWKTFGIIYPPRAINISSLKFRQLSLIEIPCLQGFQSFNSGDLWPPWKTIGIIYVPRATNIPSLKFRQLSLVEIPCLQGFQTLTSGDLHGKQKGSSMYQGLPTYQVWSSGNFHLLRYRVYKQVSHTHACTPTHTPSHRFL